MITNIDSITGFHRSAPESTLVSPDAAKYFGVGSCDREGFDFLLEDSTTFSINTLPSNLSLPSLDLTAVHKEPLVESPRKKLAVADDQRRSLVVKSPFLKTCLPIPRFKYDDISIGSNYEKNTTSPQGIRRSKREEKPVDDISIGSNYEKNTTSPQGIRRSKREKKPVDLCKRYLETAASNSSGQRKSVHRRRQGKNHHPCSERGKRLSINCSSNMMEDSSDDESSANSSDGSVVDEGEYEIDRILKQKINKDGQVFYLIKWKPTWEPKEIEGFKREGQGNGAWKLERILKRRDGEIFCQWANSWEPEDNILGDDILLEAWQRFRRCNHNTNNDQNSEVSRYEFEGKINTDDDQNSEVTRYEFEGKIYDTYMEMVKAKRARNQSVLRRIMNERMNETVCRQPS